MLMALDRDLEDPTTSITKWPKWPQLLQCSPESVVDHPWCTHGDNVPAATQDSEMEGQQEMMAKMDKGKGGADEVSTNEVSPSEPVGREGRSHGRGRGRGQTRGRSQSCRPRKHVKSAATVDSKDEVPSMTTQCPATKTYNLFEPPSDCEILPVIDRCDKCA